MNDLPLNGRNFTQILNLTPGVSTVNVSQNAQGSGGIWSNPIGTFSYPSVNGQTNRSNLFLLDGINNQGSFGSTYAVAPIVDDIQEFKVQIAQRRCLFRRRHGRHCQRRNQIRNQQVSWQCMGVPA